MAEADFVGVIGMWVSQIGVSHAAKLVRSNWKSNPERVTPPAGSLPPRLAGLRQTVTESELGALPKTNFRTKRFGWRLAAPRSARRALLLAVHGAAGEKANTSRNIQSQSPASVLFHR